MRNNMTPAIIIFIILVLLSACSEPQKSDNDNRSDVKLTVSAAISLTDALEEIKALYEADHDVSVHFNFGSSGKLAQQIEQGAPSDLFISANQEWMDTLEDKTHIDTDTRTDLTGNNLVLIARENAPFDISELSEINPDEFDQIAIGNPESVPAGTYTKQALKQVGIWETARENVILAKDVRQVLTYVESGNTDIGFVYESDARTSDEVEIITEAEEDIHDSIIYPAAVVDDTNEKEAAESFLDYMATDEAQAIFKKYGFEK